MGALCAYHNHLSAKKASLLVSVCVGDSEKAALDSLVTAYGTHRAARPSVGKTPGSFARLTDIARSVSLAKRMMPGGSR